MITPDGMRPDGFVETPGGDTAVKYVSFDDNVPVVLLHRVDDTDEPDHCIHGQTVCVLCRAPVYLGDETLKKVSAGQAMPLCIRCGVEHIPEPYRGAVGHVRDHQRSEGPHT
jgi:hypothetical protein